MNILDDVHIQFVENLIRDLNILTLIIATNGVNVVAGERFITSDHRKISFQKAFNSASDIAQHESRKNTIFYT